MVMEGRYLDSRKPHKPTDWTQPDRKQHIKTHMQTETRKTSGLTQNSLQLDVIRFVISLTT